MEFKIKPCPFCGNDTATLIQQGTRYGYIVFVQCQICGAQTRAFGSKKSCIEVDWETDNCYSAVLAWNTRPKKTETVKCQTE